jgi:CRISPR/Cas system endoribonuclease Cas6 (RAMP superfamily)
MMMTLRMPEAAAKDAMDSHEVRKAGFIVHPPHYVKGFGLNATGWVSFRVECPRTFDSPIAVAKELAKYCGWGPADKLTLPERADPGPCPF